MKRWSDSKIKSHIKARYSIFKSIKKHGYDPKFDNSNPIQVLKQPFWKTRFGLDEPWLNGLEIWNGAGRCAAAYALGIDRLKVKMCTDRYPGTNDKGKFKDKLKSVKGVWSD